jgi:hypothetical protein
MHEYLAGAYRALGRKSMDDFLERIVTDREQHQIGTLNDCKRIGEFYTRQQRLSPNSREIRNSMRSNDRVAGTTKSGSQNRSGSAGANNTHI